MISRRQQSGLSPTWSRGRLIEDTAGYFAGVSLLLAVVPLTLGYALPALDPGGPRIGPAAIFVIGALIFGTIWLALRQERLRLALVAVGLIFTLIAAAILWTIVSNAVLAQSLDGTEGLAVYGFGTLLLVGLWLAFGEVRAELARRRQPEASP